jgi:hypothetical protein
MSGGISATTTGPNATQQMNASHSARRYFSIHTGTEPFWPHEWRHPTPVSPVRATVKRLFIGSAPDALLSAPVQLKIALFLT